MAVFQKDVEIFTDWKPEDFPPELRERYPLHSKVIAASRAGEEVGHVDLTVASLPSRRSETSDLYTTIEGAATLKHVTRKAVYDALKSERLPGSELFDRKMIALSDLEQWNPWPKSHGGARKGVTVTDPQSKENIRAGQLRRWENYRNNIRTKDEI